MIKTDVRVPIGYRLRDIEDALLSHLPLEQRELSDIQIIKRTLDVKDKGDIHYKMTVALSLSEEREAELLKMRKKVSLADALPYDAPISKLKSRPVVVGCGPCGLFAALILAESGACPIVLERGLSVDERTKKVDTFKKLSILDTECNVQFGEGGAGTYSDGKLKSGAPDKYKMKVLREFVKAGADEEILYSQSAHLGTDKLPDIVKSLREYVISLGGEFIFSARLSDIRVSDSRVKSAVYIRNGEKIEIETENIILATGHSAEDSFLLLEKLGVPMEARGFGMGLRIEHPREHINKLVYGENPPTGLETASYRLVTHLPSGRSVYSFCMCPGGTVVAATSTEKGIVTNGMSEYMRDGENSNAAFLVSLTPADFPTDSPLSGIALQRRIEKAAYSLTDSYRAPSIRMSDFLENASPKSIGSVNPTYPLGTELIAPEKYLPPCVTDSLRAAIPDFDAWMPGFYFGDAMLTGPETRSTSPVRVLRNESYECPTIRGLYPAGEGAGYSGGIVSSAVDGIKCAEAVLYKR